MTETSIQIAKAFFAIGRATAGLPFTKVPASERHALAGRLFPDGPCFVEAVSEALAGAGSPRAAEAREHQEAASAFFFLRARLLFLTQMAADSYLFHQSEAIRKAQLASEQAPRQDRVQQLALLPAALIWYAYLSAQRAQKARHKEARQPAQAEKEHPTAPSRGQKQRQLRQQERRRTAMNRLFEALREKRLRELGQAEMLDTGPSPIDGPDGGDHNPRTDFGSEAQDEGPEGDLRPIRSTGPRRIIS